MRGEDTLALGHSTARVRELERALAQVNTAQERPSASLRGLLASRQLDG